MKVNIIDMGTFCQDARAKYITARTSLTEWNKLIPFFIVKGQYLELSVTYHEKNSLKVIKSNKFSGNNLYFVTRHIDSWYTYFSWLTFSQYSNISTLFSVVYFIHVYKYVFVYCLLIFVYHLIYFLIFIEKWRCLKAE
jgi:hypothetical protein